MKKYIIYWAGWLKKKLELFLENQNKRQLLERIREIEEAVGVAKEEEQRLCPHVAGSNPLSESRDYLGRTSIVWHTLPTKETVGICLNCQKQFWPQDEDYEFWKHKPSMCRASSGVDRSLGAPMSALDPASSAGFFEVPVEVAWSKDFDEKWGW